MKTIYRHSLFALLFAFTANIGMSCSRLSKNPPIEQVMLQEFKKLDKLILTEVNVRKVVSLDGTPIHFEDIESVRDIALWGKGLFKVGDRIGIYSFNSTLVASVDFSQTEAKNITKDKDGVFVLQVPQINVEILGRDFTLKKEYEHVSGLRFPITPEERATAKDFATEKLEKEILGNSQFTDSIRKKAEEKLKDWVARLLTMHGEENPTVRVEYIGTNATK